MGFTQARRQAILDSELSASDYVAYSENGTTESGLFARTAISAWTSASAADPSVKSNNAQITSAAASGAGTITHFAVYSAVTAGTQKTNWQALTTPRTVASGDYLQWAANALQVTLGTA